ncbi:uncharacterized protein AB9W97_002363 [Spinachia spinachia]
MHLNSLLLFLNLGALVKCAAVGDWCYSGCYHSPQNWADLSHFCGGQRQSPVDVVAGDVKTDLRLLNFAFVNFSSPHVIKSIVNNGHTVKCMLEPDEVEVSEGGLNGTYSALQLHFHWGDEHHPGSEHTVDGYRYPMEMHIVSLKKGLSVENAKNDSEGIAVLAFFINGRDDGETSGPWSELTSYLTNVHDTAVAMNHNISIDDLIGNVDRTKFYRYMGSLTTPDCSEAVVWTVFQEPINVHSSLVKHFPVKTGLTNVHRTIQPLNGRSVFASSATLLPPGHSWCYEEGACEYSPSQWPTLPHSYCGGEDQSPVDIETQAAVLDENLDAFSFTKFDDKNAIMYITNTGHSVKCVLKEDLLEVSGGGLQYDYSTLQFHFHWGSKDTDGSEHKVDSKRYPMEMHIVNKRKDLTLEEALETKNGLAVLGFFIEPKASDNTSSKQTNPTSDMEVWKILTSYISAVINISSEVNFTDEISIDDLLGDVNRVEYYRYTGSLTTPSCNEAVVWTVFKESVKVDEDLMMLFPAYAGYENVYRPTQSLHNRIVYTTSAASNAPDLFALRLLLACLWAFSYTLRMRDKTSAETTSWTETDTESALPIPGHFLRHGGGVRPVTGWAERINRSVMRLGLRTQSECASKMNCLGTLLILCVLVPGAHFADGSIAWCYHLPTCNDANWATIATRFCNGTRQSPINIVSRSVQTDSNLNAFTLNNFSSPLSMVTITNTGKTVKVDIQGVGISGGGLSENYDTLQFHLHWGSGASLPGSEHTVDGKRYPIELHIVNSKSSYNRNTTLAVADPEGLAALGFFIEEMAGDTSGQPAGWQTLSSYLAQIPNSGDKVSMSTGVSLNDLVPGVDTSRYYRYLGSLTTPSCNEAVVWTVFKDTVKVSRDVIDRFSSMLRVTNSSSPFIINNYRNLQPGLRVTTQPNSSTCKTCYSLGLMFLSILLGRT